MRGKLKDLTFGAHGEQHITITVTRDFREDYDRLKGSDVNVEIKKWREPRSKDANAYFHVLVNKIAEAQNLGDDEVKRSLVVEYGALAKDEDGNTLGAMLPVSADIDEFYPYMKGLLSEDEAEVFTDEETGTDVEAELRSTLAALNAKEIRLMKRINSITTSAKGGQIVRGVDKTTSEVRKGIFTEDEKGHFVSADDTDVFPAVTQNTTATHTTNMYDALDKLEAELDRVQARKIKILTKLEDIKVQRERLELERKRLDAKTGESGSDADDGGEKEIVHIYLPDNGRLGGE